MYELIKLPYNKLLWTHYLIVDLPLFHLALFLRLPPFFSFGDCFFVFPLCFETLPVSLCFLNWSVLTPWVSAVNFYGRRPVRFSGTIALTYWACWSWLLFMLSVCMSLGFDCCWIFLWWVLSCSRLTEGHSIHHVLYSVVQVWTGCVEADSSLCTRFWGFSLTLVQSFVMDNFSTI